MIKGEPLPAIRIHELIKEFPLQMRGIRLRAVDRLSLDVPEGRICGLLGPNGSGKTTTIKVILGLLKATSGECEVFGRSSQRVASRSNVGYLPEAPELHRFLSGREFVEFHARLSGMPRPAIRDRAARVIASVGLEDAADRRLGTYSKGMQQRIGMAQALVHDPRLVILDEPTAGVDPVGTAELTKLILNLRSSGKTVLLSSHLLAQVEDICDRVAILHRGRLILEADVAELAGTGKTRAVIVENLEPAVAEELRPWLAARGARLRRIENPRANLDQIFLERVGSARQEKPPGPPAP